MKMLFRALLFVFLCTPLFGQTFYVAPNGDDSAAGTEAAPFATLDKARDAARAARKAEPAKIVLRGGTHWMQQPLTLEPEDSHMIFEAYKGESPILSGGRPITGWKETAPGRWETTIKEVADGNWYFEQLFVGDQRRFRPALPKNGYFTVYRGYIKPDPKIKPDRFYYGDAPFRSDWKNLDDITVQSFHLWTMHHLRLKEVDEANKKVFFTAGTHNYDQAPLVKGTSYRIVNVYEALNEPGEWYLDRKTGVLTYLAKPGEDMNKMVVIAPLLRRLVTITGDVEKEKFVENVQFRDLTFAHTAWYNPPEGEGFGQAAVHLDATITAKVGKKLVVSDCVIRHTGNYAVEFGEACEDCVVERSELIDLGGGGVKIGTTGWGGENDEKHWAKRCIVRQCHIAHGARIFAESIGVWIANSPYNVVEENDIFDFYYSTVSVGWNWGPSFSPSHHNLITKNHLYQIGQGVTNDMAGIYTLGHSPGTVLSYNWIHDVHRVDYGAWGLYYDESTQDIISEHNLVYDTEDATFHQHFGTDNILRKNILAFSEGGFIRISRDPPHGPIGPLTFEENIFYLSNPRFIEHRFDEKSKMKGNTYWCTTNADELRFPGDRTFEEWKRDREPDAVFADPGFVDPAQRNFKFKDPSKSKDIGLGDVVPGNPNKKLKTTNLPPVPRAYPPSPKDAARTLFAMNEDFEEYLTDEPIPDWHCEVTGECSIEITDEAGAGGSKRSLKFFKGEGATHDWIPHLTQDVEYHGKVVTASFDWRVEKEAHPRFEMRGHYRPMPGYSTGPSIEVHPSGKLVSRDTAVMDVPLETWFNVAMTLDLKNSPEKFTLTVTIPDKAPQTFELPCSATMKSVDWFGFCTFGKVGAVHYVDNLKIEAR